MQDGVKIINRAGSLLDEIGMASESVNVQVQDISKSSAEQSKNIEAVSVSIENLSLATKMTTSEVDQVLSSLKKQKDNIFEMTKITRHLAMVSDELKRMLANFVLDAEGPQMEVKRPQRSVDDDDDDADDESTADERERLEEDNGNDDEDGGDEDEEEEKRRAAKRKKSSSKKKSAEKRGDDEEDS